MARRSKTRAGKRKQSRRTQRRLLRALLMGGLRGALLLIIISLILVLPWRWLNPPMTSFMWQAARQSDHANVQQWLPFNAISANVTVAIIASEDQLFFAHHGFDFRQIKEALSAPGGPQRGASTITQQLAKNMYLWPGQSYARKLLEAWFTLTIEVLWSKRRILEVYLNIAEFGPNIYGVGAAASTLLDTKASELSPYQGALLAAVLPNPKRMSARQPSAYVRQRARTILDSTEQLGGKSYLDHHP